MSDSTAEYRDPSDPAHPVGMNHHDDHHEHHVVGWKLLTGVFLILMVLTVLTVAAINVDLGPLNIFVAMGIALVKALLVVFIFMHIWWDRAFHGLLIAGSLAFVTLFIAFTMIDSNQYENEIIAEDQNTAKAKAESGTYTPPQALP